MPLTSSSRLKERAASVLVLTGLELLFMETVLDKLNKRCGSVSLAANSYLQLDV